MNKELEDTDLASRSYILTFFMNVNKLNDALTGYRSIILRLKVHTGTDPKETAKELEKLSDEMKTAVIQWSDTVRSSVENCHLLVTAIATAIGGLETTTLDDNYKKIINRFTPDLEDVSKYAFEINKTYVKSTIERILNKMAKFYEEFSQK